MTATESLNYNCEMIGKLARFMSREIAARTKTGDINRVCQAGEALSGACHFRNPSIGCIIDMLQTCNAEQWLNFIMVNCGGSKRRYLDGYTPSDLLKIISGRNRQEWLDYENRTCRHPDAPC